ncbi:MAG: histidine kinase dimerization/phospho-acceptor domain-containing protein, partial [Acidimicrobiia bacterium]
MSEPRMPPPVRTYVAGLSVVAVVAVVAAAWSAAPEFGLQSMFGLAAGMLALAIVRAGMRGRRTQGDRSEIFSYEETLFPLLLVTLGPELSVLVFGLGTVAVNVRVIKRGLKVAFNVAHFTVAAALAATVAALIGFETDIRAVMSVLFASATYVLSTTVIFGTLVSFRRSESWISAIRSEFRDTVQVGAVQVLLGSTGALGILAMPAVTPVVIVMIVVVLRMHMRWYQLTRDRERIDDLLHVTVDLHGSLTTSEVGRRLTDAIYTLVSADAELVAGESVAPADGMVFELDAGSAGVTSLVVHRDTVLDPTAIAICETLARVAGVSYRMAALLEEHEEQTADLRAVIAEREAFLSATAHQLRTPLTAMVGFLSLLWQQPDDPQVIKEMMSHLIGQAGEMTHHLDNLLVSSRALTDSVMISRDDVDLRTEAERAVAALPPGGALVSVIGESARTLVDAVRLRHIL